MSRSLLWLLVALSCSSILGGCSLVVDPAIDGLPCGADDLCREGYGCVAGKCIAGAAPVDNSGPDTPCGGCADGFTCDAGLNRCIQDTGCGRCAPGEHCEGNRCVETEEGGVGAPCRFDSECSVGTCLLSATGSGVCGVPCGGDGDCAAGELCTTPEGAPASFCLPESFAMCSRQADCEPLGGAVCTLWNFGGSLTGACASPRAGGDGGAPCASGNDCANGLCGATGFCTGPCTTAGDTADCPIAGDVCAFSTVWVGSVSAEVTICVAQGGPAGGGEGACCGGNEECDSGMCATRSDRAFSYCADPTLGCSFDSDCQVRPGWACDGGAGLCAPSPSCTN